jgi:hypothetical protein
VHGDEAGLAAHELDDSHAVERGLGLHGSRLDGLLRLLHGGVEAECFIDVEDVVVDRLRDADDGNLEPAAGALGADRVGPSVAPVTADHEHHVDPLPLDGIDDLRDVAAAAAATDDGTAPVLYTKHDVSSLIAHTISYKINAPALRWCCAWSAACSWRRPARTRPNRT